MGIYPYIIPPCYTRIYIINTSYPEDSPRSTKSRKGPQSCSKPVVPPPISRLRLQTSKAFLPVLILYATIPGMIRGERKIRAQAFFSKR